MSRRNVVRNQRKALGARLIQAAKEGREMVQSAPLDLREYLLAESVPNRLKGATINSRGEAV